MRYINYIIKCLSYVLICIFRDIMYFKAIKQRHRAREVIYSYIYHTNSKVYKIHYPILEKFNRVKVWYYFWFVWIWIDDTLDGDIIDREHIHYLIMEDKIPRIVQDKLMLDIMDIPRDNLHASIYYDKTVELDLELKFLTIFSFITNYNRSNFNYYYLYTANKDLVFSINIKGYKFGYIPAKEDGSGIQFYKLVFLHKED